MRKVTMMFIVFAWLLIGISSNFSNVFAEGEQYIVNDTFDDEAGNNHLTGWTISPNDKSTGNYGEIVTDPENKSNKCLDLVKSKTNIVGVRTFGPLKGLIVVDYKIRFDKVDVLSHLPAVRNLEGKTIVVFMVDHGKLILRNGTRGNDDNYYVPNLLLESNKWYHFRIELDTNAGTHSVYLDDTKLAADFKMPNNTVDGALDVRFEGRGSNHYIDDLKIYKAGEGKIDPTKILSNSYELDYQASAIKNVKYETTLQDFKNALINNEGTILEIYEPDGITKKEAQYIQNNDKVIVKTQDGNEKRIYTVQVNPLLTSSGLRRVLEKSVVLFVNSSDSLVQNVRKKIDENNQQVVPIIKDGSTLVPVRFVSEAMGGEVSFDETTSTIHIKTADKNIEFVLGDTTYKVNETSYTLNVPAQVINDRTFIPLRAAVEALGKKVRWDDRGLIIINDDDKIFDSVTKQLWIDEIAQRFVH